MHALQTRTAEDASQRSAGNRLLEQADWIRGRLDTLHASALACLEETLEIDPDEAIAYLEGQARAAAKRILTSDEALTIYQALTPQGWEPDTRLELKMTIATLMGSLLYT